AGRSFGFHYSPPRLPRMPYKDDKRIRSSRPRQHSLTKSTDRDNALGIIHRRRKPKWVGHKVTRGNLTPLRHAEPRAPSRLSEFPASGPPVHAPPDRRPLGVLATVRATAAPRSRQP